MARGFTTALTLRPWAIAAYFVVFALAGLVALGYVDRSSQIIDVEAIVPEFYAHASNVLISYGLIVTYGLLRLLCGARLREIAIFTAAVIAANYAYEMGLTLWNTKDITDAHFGALASLATFALLAAIQRRGLKRLPAVQAAEDASKEDSARRR